MQRSLARALLAALLAAAVLAVTGGSNRRPTTPAGTVDVIAFLRADAGFSAEDIHRLERGDVIAKGLAADDETVAIVAAMQVDVPADFFLDSFRQIDQFKKAPEVQQIGRFGPSPSAEDLASLTLDPGELKDARQCKVGDCAFKLDAAGIQRLRDTRDDAAAMSALREHLADYASRYLREGNAALMDYRDRSRPLALKSQLQRILSGSPHLQRDWPELHAAVGGFAGTLPAGLEQFLYWSKEKVAARPVVSVTHAIIRPARDGVAAIATKQVYASHYTTGSLGMTLLAERGEHNRRRTLMAYVNRTRVDVFRGVLGAVKRPVVRSRARSGAERMMKMLRVRLEQGWNEPARR